MKKSIFFAALMLGAFVLTGCNKGGEPTTDTTKLWPAQANDDSNWGYFNGKDAKLAISAKFQSASSFSCGYALVTDDGGESIFIGTDGKKVSSKMQVDNGTPIGEFYYDVCRVTIDGFFAFLDKDFKKLTRAEFVELSENMTADGLAYCKINGDDLMGYCDKEGNIKIKANYNKAYDFADGIAVVMEKQENGDELYYIIDTKGNALSETFKNRQLINLGEQRVYYTTDQGKVVMLDKNGNEIELASTYSAIEPFTDGLAKVTNKNGDKIGYINPNGREVIELVYANGLNFYEGLAWVQTSSNSGNGKWQVIDNKGGDDYLKLSSTQSVGYRNMPTYFHNGLTYYNNGTKVFIADKKGDVKYDWKIAGGGPAPARQTAAKMENPMRGTKYGPIFDAYLRIKQEMAK